MDRTAREHRDVPGNETLPQGQGPVVFQEVQVTQTVTDVSDSKYNNYDKKDGRSRVTFCVAHRIQINPPGVAFEKESSHLMPERSPRKFLIRDRMWQP